MCLYRLPNATEVAATSLVQAMEEKFEMTHELNSKLIQIKCSDTQRRTEVSSARVQSWAGVVPIEFTQVGWVGVGVGVLTCCVWPVAQG